ncbi:hypothetical protein BG011_001276 [Mortierella polycephala]|uniref:Uncharacterized protein n=1 Tax=Mortierella polycephala TaxID=41804 RepID=A0A9P6Q916_9FUNG|nr:hypothetical protein BG011_001276 [Mortierella polycephala]
MSARPKEASPEQNTDLAQLMRDAPDDGKGRMMIEIPIGVESINMARKIMISIRHWQQERNEVRIPGPAALKELDSLIKHHQGRLFEQFLQSPQISSEDCVLRDSYPLSVFIDMMDTLWQKNRQTREYDLHYCDMFCISARHNMLFRDQDLRYLYFSDCFCTIVQCPHIGAQQPIGLIFKLNKEKTNKKN